MISAAGIVRNADTRPELVIGDRTYVLRPIANLDSNLRDCPPEHRDALLDARLMLYP